MATTLQFIAYDTTSLSGLVGSNRELYVDTSKSTIVVMDGVTPGGTPLVTEELLTSYAVTASYVSSQLTSYATLNYVSSELTNYATLEYFESDLVNYVLSDNLTSTLTNYPTNANLTSTLTSYPTNANLTSTLSSALVPYATTSYLTSYVTNTNLTSTLSSYVTNNSLSSQLTSYATLTYVNGLNNETDVIEPLTLAPGFVFYSGTSATSLTTGTAFSSVSVISDSIIRISNPVDSTITSVTNLSIGSKLLVNYSSITHVAEVLNTPVFPTQIGLLQTFFSFVTISPGSTFSLSSSATSGLLHNASVTRAGFPQIVYLTEGSDFTVSGTTLTINIEITSAVGINVTETNTSALDINYSSNTINNNFTFSNLDIGYNTSSTSYNGSDPGFLAYTNPNGVRYYSDGRIEYPNNLTFNSSGTIVLPPGGQVLDNTGNTIGITINDVNSSISSTLATYPFTTEPLTFSGGTYLYNESSSTTYNASTSSGGLYYDATVGSNFFSVFVAGSQNSSLVNAISSTTTLSLITVNVDNTVEQDNRYNTRPTSNTTVSEINLWKASSLDTNQTSLTIVGADYRYINQYTDNVSGVTSTEVRSYVASFNYRLFKNGSLASTGGPGSVNYTAANGDVFLFQQVVSGTAVTISVGKDASLGTPGDLVEPTWVKYNVPSFTLGYTSAVSITGATSLTVVNGTTTVDPGLKKFGEIKTATASSSNLVVDFAYPVNVLDQDENVTSFTFVNLPPKDKTITTEVFIKQVTTGNALTISPTAVSGISVLLSGSHSTLSGTTDVYRFTAVNSSLSPTETSVTVYGVGLSSGNTIASLTDFITYSYFTSNTANFATVTYVSNTLTSYTTYADLTSVLNSFATKTFVTTSLLSYTTNTNLTSTLSNYVTNANLTSTLNSYSFSNYVTNNNLTSTLAAYVLTSTLTSYATKADLNSSISSLSSTLATSLGEFINITSTVASYVSNLVDTFTSVSVTTGILTLNFNYDYHRVILNQNVVNVNFINLPQTGEAATIILEVEQDLVGGYSISGSSFLTAGGAGLSISTTVSAISIVSFTSRNGGDKVFGISAGRDWI
jgi:hypothetical protein